ncbi:MAG TPA: hypothetical protein VGT02_16610 [Methylomirabilota bacterium]|jgi:hypothetical protein|nr:hypothetical protein [Methylomirabilota bacterium]
MKSTVLTAVVMAAVVALAGTPAFGADPKTLPPASKTPSAGTTTPAVLAKKPDLQPVISTAGAEPKFGVMNTGQANAAGEFWITVNCLPTNFAAQGHCKLNASNDPMVDPNTNKFKVTGGVLQGGVPQAKWFGLGNVPGATGPGGWASGGWKFKITVDSQSQIAESNNGNNSSQWHTWTK